MRHSNDSGEMTYMSGIESDDTTQKTHNGTTISDLTSSFNFIF